MYRHARIRQPHGVKHKASIITVAGGLVYFCRLTEEDEEETIEKQLSTELAKKRVQYGF